MPSSVDEDGQKKPRLRETALAQGLTYFAAILLASLTTKLGLDVTHSPSAQGAIAVVASAIGTGISAAYGVFVCWTKSRQIKEQSTKVQRAEILIPGVTSETGPIDSHIVIKNDPTSTAPPRVTVLPPEAETSP